MTPMTRTTKGLAAAAEAYFADLRRVRASGGATGERSIYGPLANLLNGVGATLKPKVFCVGELEPTQRVFDGDFPSRYRAQPDVVGWIGDDVANIGRNSFRSGRPPKEGACIE